MGKQDLKAAIRNYGFLLALVAFGLAAPPEARADSALSVFDWSGYEDPGFHQAYVAKEGKSPDFSYYADEEEAFQKLRAGYKADLAHPCSQSTIRWRQAGLLRPIDTSKIAAWNDLNPKIRDIEGFKADGQYWMVPFEWGNSLMTYRTDKVSEADRQTLRSFADPKFRGQVSLPDNVDDAFALASLVIGLKDMRTMTDAQFQEAAAFLRDVHKNVKIYWTENTEISQAIASGEVTLAWTWSETPTSLKNAGQPVDMNRDTKEGSSTWFCGYALLKGNEANDARAYEYLNAILSDDSAAHLVDAWGYGHANMAAMAKIDKANLEKHGFTDVDKFIDKTLFQAPLPTDLRERMIAEWEKIKTGF